MKHYNFSFLVTIFFVGSLSFCGKDKPVMIFGSEITKYCLVKELAKQHGIKESDKIIGGMLVRLKFEQKENNAISAISIPKYYSRQNSDTWASSIVNSVVNVASYLNPFSYDNEQELDLLDDLSEDAEKALISVAQLYNLNSQQMQLYSHSQIQQHKSTVIELEKKDIPKNDFKDVSSEKDAYIIAYMNDRKYTHVPYKVNEDKWHFIERQYIVGLSSDCYGEACLYNFEVQNKCKQFLRSQGAL